MELYSKIFTLDFNPCEFFHFDWCNMLNGYVNVLFDIFSLGMTVVSVETLEN